MAISDVRYTDFTTNFLENPISGDLGIITDIYSIKNSIKNLVLTDKYERLLDPNIGTNINHLLFENMDGRTAKVIQNYVRETINNYEPRAQLLDVICTPDFSKNAYYIQIKFTVLFAENIQTVDFYLNRVR